MLRDAIDKVFDEIRYHEREAQRHMQLVKELRRDLRESFTLAMDQKGKKELARLAVEDHAESVLTPSAIPDPTPLAAAGAKRPRIKRRKKRAGRRKKAE
jgi:hypothetical protein